MNPFKQDDGNANVGSLLNQTPRPLPQWRSTRGGSFVGAGAVIVLLGLSVGCASRGGILGVDCCADIPAGAIPPPAGTKVCDWQTVQVNSAISDQTVFYQADFVGRSTALAPAAVGRLSRHVQSNLANVQTWIIEPSGDETLDLGRVTSVANELSQRGIESPEVQLATPAALGVSGPQAERIAAPVGSVRNSNLGTGAPLSRPVGVGSFRAGSIGAF